MKILLINPPYSTRERYGAIASFGPNNEPLGLAYIASSLEKNNYDVAICDAEVAGLNIEDIIKKVQDEAYDVVGISMITPTYAHVKKIAVSIKKRTPHVILIVGGPHPSALPKETLKEIPSIDYVITGEGELSMV